MAITQTQLCFFLILFITVKGESSKTCPETNGDKPEIIPDNRDCTKFYICDGGLPWAQNCSAGLYFNPVLEVCDRPENVVYCEYDDFVYLKPHCSCSKYIICDYGEVEVRNCTQGYHFPDISFKKFSLADNPCDLGEC